MRKRKKPRGSFSVRLSASEKRLVQRAAAKLGMGATTFARAAILSVSRRRVRPAVFDVDAPEPETVPLGGKGA